MDKIFIDESGYTGSNLLDENQPFQGASSLMIDEKMAESLIKKHFPKSQSIELKHQNLSRRKNNWNDLLRLQEEILNNFMGFSYICNKKYFLLLLFLNSCVEPFFYNESELDFYENGHNFVLASLLYYTAPNFWGDRNYNEFLHLFQKAMKYKSSESIQALCKKAKSLNGKKLSENLIPLSMEYQPCIQEIQEQLTSTDIASIVLSSLISHIEKHTNSKYEVIHDISRGLDKYNRLIKLYINNDDTVKFKMTEITSLSFPLKLSSVKQKESHLSYGLQLADILIGGIMEYCMALGGSVKKNDYNQSVIDLYNKNNILHIIPNPNIEEIKNFHSDSQAKKLIKYLSQSKK